MTGFTDRHQAAREPILALALGQRIARPLATLHPLTHPHVPVSGAAPSALARARRPHANLKPQASSLKPEPYTLNPAPWRQARELCEQLRLVLEPTLASKLKGDFKSGKRINLKKIIPFIASQFKRDKIWLRRTAPVKRTYQV